MRRPALLAALRALPASALVLAAAAAPLAGCETTVDLGAATPPGATTTPPGVRPQADKIDLLFAVDDSASMADKQHVLASTVPRLVERFVHPRCLDGAGAPNGYTASSTGACTSGTPEFKPVTDIHIGIVTSSMGNFGTTATCDTKGTNLRGHLVNDGRIAPIAHEPSGFLAYTGNAASAGSGPLNPYTDAEKFAANFGTFINNLEESGCGYESQLESVQHFLMQPDPWSSIARDGDTVLIKPGTYRGDVAVWNQKSLEIRGLGIVPMPFAAEAGIALLVDLVPRDRVERLPEDEVEEIAGVRLRRIRLCPFDASTPLKVAEHHGVLFASFDLSIEPFLDYLGDTNRYYFERVFDGLDEAIRIIRKSDGKQDAAVKLMKAFRLDEIQADAILETKLYRLAKLEIEKIRAELA